MVDLERFISVRFASEEVAVLTDFFQTLQTERIPYVVLRGYQLLPECCISAGTADIDILIDCGEYARAQAVARRVGLQPLAPSVDRPLSRMSSLFRKGLRSPRKALMRLATRRFNGMKDLWAGRMTIMDARHIGFRFGALYVDLWEHLGHRSLLNRQCRRLDSTIEKDMLASRVLQSDLFYVPAPPDALAHLVNRVVLDKEGSVPELYRTIFHDLSSRVNENEHYRQVFRSLLARTYFKMAGFVEQKVYAEELDTLRSELITSEAY